MAPGSTVKVIIETANYIQAVQDVAMSFGFATKATAFKETLGSNFLDSKFLGPDDSNIITNITHLITIPSTAANGDIVFTAAKMSLLGVTHGPDLEYFTVNAAIGDSTSGDYVSSN
jgi:hypothetical protein